MDKNCIFCGKPLEPGASFCTSCGNKAVDIPVPKPQPSVDKKALSSSEPQPAVDSQKYSSIFVNKNEKFIDVLGNSMAQTFFSTGQLGNGFAILSDKRIYFKGECFIRTGKHFHKQWEERIVDVEDATGTGIVYKENVIMIVLLCISFFVPALAFAINFFLGLFLCLVPVLVYYLYNRSKHTLLEVSFAGGGIAFDINWMPEEEGERFQKNLITMRDQAKADKEKPAPLMDDVAGQLQKFKELLDQGVLNQAEFDAKKKQLLGL